MSEPFKVGDWVVCLDNTYFESTLTLQARYQIVSVHEFTQCINLGGFYSFNPARFRLAPAPIDFGDFK